MEVAALTTKVEVDVSKLGPSLDSLKTNVEALGKNMTTLGATITNLADKMEKAGAGTAKLKKPTDDMGGSTANLGRYMRELTTSMLGVNPISIALGTTLGNMATQLLTRLVLAIISSVTQFTNLKNELAEVQSLSTIVGSSFDVITTAAQTSQKSLTDLTTSYTSLQKSVIGTRVSVEEANKIFLEYQARLGALQQPTILSAASQALTAFGDAFARFDQLLGGSVIVAALLSIKESMQTVANLMPKTVDAATALNEEHRKAVKLLDQARQAVLDNAAGIELQKSRVHNLIQAQEKLEEVENRVRIAAEKALSPEALVTRMNLVRNTTADLQQQIDVGNLLTFQQEVMNKLYAYANQLRSTGKDITKEEAIDAKKNIQLAQAASQIQTIRESNRTAEQAENESYTTRINYLTAFYGERQNLAEAYNARLAEEDNRHQAQRALIQLNTDQMLLTAQTQFGNSLANVFSIIGQKSKAAQIAGIAVSTAVNAALAWQSTLVAAARAQAELGPVLGPPMAANITAWGIANVAAIIAAGALNIGAALSPPSGGSSGSSSGSGSGTTPNTSGSSSSTPKNFGQAITIEGTDPAMVYTGKQLIALVDRINDAVKNGATLITTKTRGG